MSLLQWLRSRFQKAPINRVPMVTCEGNVITFQWSASSTDSINLNDVCRVLIRTTDAGPFDEDVFFVVETTDDSYVIPQGAVGVGELLNRLQDLPGFENQAVIDAMGCTANREFLCWQRDV